MSRSDERLVVFVNARCNSAKQPTQDWSQNVSIKARTSLDGEMNTSVSHRLASCKFRDSALHASIFDTKVASRWGISRGLCTSDTSPRPWKLKRIFS